MRYDLGLMDMYPIEASGTIVENDPLFKLVMKEEVDPVRLEDAIYRAIKFHPLFGTQVGYDGSYYLETNNRPIKLVRAREEERPLEFCRTTNGYPWQCCYSGKEITFEWCHGIADGMAALDFIRTMLSIYCGVEFEKVPRKIDLGPGLEPFVDKNEKGVNYEKQPKGFNVRAIPVFKRGYKTDCHVIEGNTGELLKLARFCESSPCSVLAVLLSKTLRSYLPSGIRNRNVACNIVMDLRRPLKYQTQHNCVEYLRLTYQDKHEDMSLPMVAREYKAVLDNARIRENIVRIITERVTLFKAYHLFRTKAMKKRILSLLGLMMKDTDCNCVVTYLGKCDFPQVVYDSMEDFQVRVWHDFGECCLAAVDFNGVFKINICENYIQKGIVEDFVALAGREGLHLSCVESRPYEQGKFIEE